MNLKKIWEKIKQNQDAIIASTTSGLIVSAIVWIIGFIIGKVNNQAMLSLLAYKVPIIWLIGSNLIVGIIIIVYFNKKNNISEDKIMDNKLSEIDIEIDTKILDRRILNYNSGIIEGTKFKWDYRIVDTGYKIVNLKAICKICGSELEKESSPNYDERDLINVDIKLTCYKCLYEIDKHDTVNFNQDAQLVYFSEMMYDEFIKIIKSKIKYNALQIKSDSTYINKVS